MGDEEYGALVRVLRKVDFFAELSVAELDEVFKYIALYEYESGKTVCKQGAPGDSLYIVHEGSLEVSVKKMFLLPSKVVGHLKSGDFFGETALLENRPRTATVKTESRTKLFVLLRTDFDIVLGSNPSFAKRMQTVSAHRKFATRNAA